MKKLIRDLSIAFIVFALGIGILALIPTIRPTLVSTFRLLFALTTTPFIMETLIFLSGSILVLTLNEWRKQKNPECVPMSDAEIAKLKQGTEGSVNHAISTTPPSKNSSHE